MKDIVSLTVRSSAITMRIQNLTKRASQGYHLGHRWYLSTQDPCPNIPCGTEHANKGWGCYKLRLGTQTLLKCDDQQWPDLYKVNHHCNTCEAALLCARTSFNTISNNHGNLAKKGKPEGPAVGVTGLTYFPRISHVNVQCSLHVLYCCLSILIKNYF